MKTYTKAEFKSLALQQWKSMYIHGSTKYNALIRMKIAHADFPRNCCFACEYALKEDVIFQEQRHSFLSTSICDYCPVHWGSKEGDNHCTSYGSPFKEWLDVLDSQKEKLCAYEVYRTIQTTWEVRDM